MDMEAKGEIDTEKYAANIFSIREAQKRINSFIHKTPVVTSESLYAMSGKKLFLKCECFHKGGAFKFRGTCNAISSLDGGEAAKRVVTHSRLLILPSGSVMGLHRAQSTGALPGWLRHLWCLVFSANLVVNSYVV